MTIQELITELQAFESPNSKVYVWVDGNRMPVHSVDHFEECTDVNAIPEGMISYYA
jgi:hypothetical protein